MMKKSAASFWCFAWFLGVVLCVSIIGTVYFSAEHLGDVDAKPLHASRALPPVVQPVTSPAVLPYNKDNDQYILLAFATEGIHAVSDARGLVTLLPAGNTVVAQLMTREGSPAAITNDVMVTCFLPASTTGVEGSFTQEMVLELEGDSTSFVSPPIALLPYTTAGEFAPYPVARVEARDASGALLAATQVVVAVSSELGCKSCHGGEWKTAGAGGLSDETVHDMLRAHDKHNKTSLANNVSAGSVDCLSCHTGKEGKLQLSAAIHGFHAFMGLQNEAACASCHPASPQGQTQFQRDMHNDVGLDCTHCHGTLELHAASLLKRDEQQGNARAALRLSQLPETMPLAKEQIMAREAWVNLPDCGTCHNYLEKPLAATAVGYTAWTADRKSQFKAQYDSTDQVRCGSCHGSVHALWPARNPVEADRDNLLPLQYMGFAGSLGMKETCEVCHTVPMEPGMHHDFVVP